MKFTTFFLSAAALATLSVALPIDNGENIVDLEGGSDPVPGQVKEAVGPSFHPRSTDVELSGEGYKPEQDENNKEQAENNKEQKLNNAAQQDNGKKQKATESRFVGRHL